MATILAFVAAALVAMWGVADVIPTGRVLVGFIPITQDNRRILLQEWLAEAFAMWGLGSIFASVTIVVVRDLTLAGGSTGSSRRSCSL